LGRVSYRDLASRLFLCILRPPEKGGTVMRMMLKIKMPTALANLRISDGSLGKVLEDTVSKLKAEAAYFVAEDGVRCALIFFDMKDSAEIPVIAEPLFIRLGAELELVPAMNADDLRKGLKTAMDAM